MEYSRLFKSIEWIFDYHLKRKSLKADRYFTYMIEKWGMRFILANPPKFRSWHNRYVPGKWYDFPRKESEFNPLLYFIKNNPGVKIELNRLVIEGGIQADQNISWRLWSDCVNSHIITEGISFSRVIENSYEDSTTPLFKVHMPDLE